MAADPAAEVQVVPPPAHAAALGLALQQCHRETAVHVTGQALRSYRQDSQSLRHLLAVFRGGQPVAAAWAQCMHGRTALLWGPAPLAVEQPADSDRLLAVLLRRLREEGYSLLQSIAAGEMAGDASHPAAQQSLLARHGFLPPVELLYLVSTDLTMREPPGELTFEAFREGQESRLEQLVGRTYDGTLDIPVLNDVRRLGDVLDGYRHTGHVTPQHWLFARQGGRDVGCLLLSDHPESDCLELVYMGTVPEVRGQGHGRQLVSRAMEAASAAGRDRLILAVDAANQPARRHYEQAGMKLLNRRNVSIRILSASRF